MKTIDIKGKPYVMANERIKYFRENYPNGAILTDLISDVDGKCIFKAEILVEGQCVATGYAYENENSTFINKTSYIENCETSAVGRCLGFAGFGSVESIASADEVVNAVAQQKPEFATPNQVKYIKNLCEEKNIDTSKYNFDEMTKQEAGGIIEKIIKDKS